MPVLGHGWDDNVGAPAYRNVIINGSMNVAQRNTSVASIISSGYYTADRWRSTLNAGTWTQSVENDGPSGTPFRKSLKMLCTTAKAALSAGDYGRIETAFEGQNLQQFLKGTSSAKKFALSFWVKANVTGTYIAALYDYDNSRYVAASYTINASGTWEKKTIVFPADTSGAMDNDNAQSLEVEFFFLAGTDRTSGTLATAWQSFVAANAAVGQTNVAAATNNYWQITGIQLEPEIVTPFEFEPYDTTFTKCQRYYQLVASTNPAVNQYQTIAYAYTSAIVFGHYYGTVTMRNTPVVVDNTFKVVVYNGAWVWNNVSVSLWYPDRNGTGIRIDSTGATAGTGCHIDVLSGSVYLNAEL